VDWCWSKFVQKATADVLTVPPAFARSGVKWEAVLKKENNSLRVIPREGAIWTPEDSGGPPPMVLFSPHSSIKIRTAATDSMAQMLGCLRTLYQGRYSIREEVPSREWAMVGAIGDTSQRWEIPIQYRVEMLQVSQSELVAIHGRILEAGLRTQNYDKGLDKFVRKTVGKEAMSATVAVHIGSGHLRRRFTRLRSNLR
jgi:hypothetical protein